MSQIPTYSPGSIIKEIDWVEKLAEFEKKEKIKSTVSCVTKLTSTKKPKREYEMPYKVRNVRKRTGERLPTTDMETLVV